MTPKTKTPDSAKTFSTSDAAASISYIPDKDKNFVPFGDFEDIRMIIASKQFFPFQLFGLSGCGKTFPIEQACAETRRELVRAPITVETDEDSLIGHYILENGQTLFQYGPVVIAMLRGAVLLLDEVDKASSKIMCIQPVLEGKPLLIKKTNELIFPAPGFNICSTANTKGQGDETGKFITSNHLDEAFLERFAVLYEADFPEPAIEREILNRVMKSHNVSDDEFCGHLATWAKNIRTTYKQGDEGEVISTRRMVHIANAFAIMTGGADRLKAIKLCLTRFNADIAEGWLGAYKALDVKTSNALPKKASDIGAEAFGASDTEDEHPW